MALAQEEALRCQLFHSAYVGDLNRMMECAASLDLGEGLVEIYTKLRGPAGVTALHCSAFGEEHTCKYLIEDLGLTETLQLLISSGADIEASSYAGTPLQCAASRGKTETLKILLDNNANCRRVLSQTVRGVTPLQMAAYQGYNEGIQCLLKAGASTNITNHEGITPLEVAVLRCNIEAVMILWPMTSLVPSILDWTPVGIYKALHSEEARKQREQKRKDCFMEAKSKGAEAFKKKDYLEAISWYSWAKTINPEEETVLSNRSLCWALMKNGLHALDDAEACIALKPAWAKAHYRKGVACELLEDFLGATEAYANALKLEPENQEIQKALRNVQAL